MLNHIEIENFRSLKAIDLELTPLTVLIGPNGGESQISLMFLNFLQKGQKVFYLMRLRKEEVLIQ